MLLIATSISLSVALEIIEVVTAIFGALGFLYGVFKLINWVKLKFINIDSNVVELKNSINTHMTDLKDVIQTQTESITSELKEQRSDFRTFCAPGLLYLQTQAATSVAAPVRAKRSATKKRKA